MADDAAPVCHLFMLALADAVKRAASTLGIGHGVAAARIVDAAHAGLIDGYWRGYYANRLYRYRSAGKPILRREWAGAEIDWRADVLILANGEHRALVVLDRQQFETWLSDELVEVQEGDRAEPDSDQPDGSGGHKAALVRNAAREIFGSSALKDFPPQVVFDKVAGYVQKKHGVTVSKTHTLETLGLKKRRAI